MTALNNTALQNFSNIYNDNIMLKDINNIPTYSLNGIKHLDITSYAKKINMVNSVVVKNIQNNPDSSGVVQTNIQESDSVDPLTGKDYTVA